MFGDDTYDEERAVEKLFRCIPERYRQTARSIESLLDLSNMTIEEAIGRLKVVNSDEPHPPSGGISIGGKLHLTQEQWEARRGDRRRGEPSSSTGGRKRGREMGAEVPKPGHEGAPRVAPAEVLKAAPPIGPRRHETTRATTVAGPATRPRTACSGGVGAKPMSRRPSQMTRQLCSCSTSSSRAPESSSATAPTTTGSMAGPSTPAPRTT